jgi:hypothetical protein
MSKEIKKKFYGKVGDLSIYIVDGGEVRNLHDADFCLAGHHLKWKFIPKNEAWVEDTGNKRDVEINILHEVFEHSLMSHGMAYEKAHAKALELENLFRKNIKSK